MFSDSDYAALTTADSALWAFIDHGAFAYSQQYGFRTGYSILGHLRIAAFLEIRDAIGAINPIILTIMSYRGLDITEFAHIIYNGTLTLSRHAEEYRTAIYAARDTKRFARALFDGVWTTGPHTTLRGIFEGPRETQPFTRDEIIAATIPHARSRLNMYIIEDVLRGEIRSETWIDDIRGIIVAWLSAIPRRRAKRIRARMQRFARYTTGRFIDLFLSGPP